MNGIGRGILSGIIFAGLLCGACAAQQSVGWPVYNGGPESGHYSKLTQINRENVHSLKLAWSFDTGEKGNVQANPVIIGRTLYTMTHGQRVIALDAATGKLKWRFDSGIVADQPARGVAYWTDGKDSRILAGIMNFLYCLDAQTGKPIASFGENGRVDLRKGLRGDYREQSVVLTTPGIVYKDMIIVGGRNPETHPAPPGDVRAFDVRTGALRWTFHTIPHPGEPGYETWPAGAWETAGAANNWGGMTLDVAHGIVYVPTGSAVLDFYGHDRIGNDLYADTLLALDANTGKLIWHFQGVHHDLWDRDFPAPPALFTMQRNGKTIEGIAQTTKQGYLYVFNRLTGEPLFPIHEHAQLASTVPGEVSSPTQPAPDLPLPYVRQQLTEDMLTNRTPEAHAAVLKEFRSYRNQNGGPFYPLTLDQPTIVFPGFDGGAEWGGPAIDPTTDTIYIDATEMAWTGSLTEVKPGTGLGEEGYLEQCADCHGADRAGSPPEFPSLVDIGKSMTDDQIEAFIRQGGGRMPSYPNIDHVRMTSLINFLRNGPSAPAATTENKPTEYIFTGYKRFLDPDGYPAIAPPWGILSAIDLKTGKYLWKIPLGEYPELVKLGMKNTGSEVYGGPVVTAGGVLFIGATVYDRKFHAFDSSTGKLLWETEMPFSGMATPSTYMIDGRQYVVIVSSGGRDSKGPVGGLYLAYALPKSQ